jgi:hypothetical protein
MTKKQQKNDALIFHLESQVSTLWDATHDTLHILMLAASDEDADEMDKDAVIRCSIARLVSALQIIGQKHE